jgi:multisubunit Na+/H+ antiporter MnhB subunit
VDKVLWRDWWRTGACVILAAALLLAHSPGGALSTLCGVAILVTLAMTTPALRSDWRKPLSWLAGVGGLVVPVLAGAGVLQRATDSSYEADAHRDIFPTYQQPSLDGLDDTAHNDSPQRLVELGVPAALPLVVAVALLAFECYRGVCRRVDDALYPWGRGRRLGASRGALRR